MAHNGAPGSQVACARDVRRSYAAYVSVECVWCLNDLGNLSVSWRRVARMSILIYAISGYHVVPQSVVIMALNWVFTSIVFCLCLCVKIRALGARVFCWPCKPADKGALSTPIFMR